jgi:hypothetical protein
VATLRRIAKSLSPETSTEHWSDGKVEHALVMKLSLAGSDGDALLQAFYTFANHLRIALDDVPVTEAA